MLRSVPRLLTAALAGYLVMALLQVLFLELLLEGRVAPDAPWGVQLGGLAGTAVSGLLGGWIAAYIGGARPWLGAAAAVPLVLDTVYVISRDADGFPLWFHLGGSLTILGAALAGCWWRARTRDGRQVGAAAGT